MIDLHGPSWRDWVLHNLNAGCAPGRLWQDMVAKVWGQADALSALKEGIQTVGLNLDWPPARPMVHPQNLIDLPGKTVEVVGRLGRPNAVLLDGLLTEQECQELIAHAMAKGLKTSGVVDTQTGQSVQHVARTSTSVFMKRAETPAVEALETRLCALTGWPPSHGEGLQILSYETGQQYKPHFDYFDSDKPGSALHLARGGQRLATTVVYLASPAEGGGTRFPEANLEVKPRTGGAIFFSDVDELGNPDPMSLHSGTPVVSGLKIVATYWQRAEVFK